jgi:tetratricopeptide (TPR) repeat protein
MTISVGLFRTALLLLAGFVWSGCLPSAPGDDEKEDNFLAGKSRVSAMDFEGAVESFEKALVVNPKSAPAHFELGLLYEKNKSDPAAAIYHFERFLKLQPNSGKEDMVKPRILACKQQLAQTVSLGLVTEKQQREFEQLTEEKQRLREELEKWRAYALRLQALTNQAGASLPAARAVQPPGLAQVAPADSPGTGRPSATPAATARTHIVKDHETLALIARKYGVKLEALRTANPRVEPRRLQVGQTLAIPAP